MNIDIEGIIKKLHSNSNKMDGLNEMADALASGCSTATFLGFLDKLFAGLRTCLMFDPNQMDIIMKANQVLLDMLPDIQHSDDLEIQFAQLIPAFIENLGNSKAVVRKSTHKCIATYVKISKKLEFVILHLMQSGLENPQTRTRQHSMLVIPALISLKPQILDKCAPEAVEMLQRILKKLRDPQDIVAKTARKLLMELQKCYPSQFENQLMSSLKNEEDKLICKAVLRNDEDEIQRLLTTPTTTASQSSIQGGGFSSKRSLLEEQKASSLQNSYTSGVNTGGGGGPMSLKGGPSPNSGKELSIIGKEILQSSNQNTHNHLSMISGGSSQVASMQMLDKIITEAKEESRISQAHNGLIFGFLEEDLIDALNENNQWKERTSSIETIESKLYSILSGDKKTDFLPYATNFLGFMIQYIPDINFKISLTTIKIIQRLLQINSMNIKKYYQQLATSLIEKLSDSKVVIRQAVLKSCAQLIMSLNASAFASVVLRYLQHGNWHVREGALNLMAHCIIVQSKSSVTKSPQPAFVPQSLDADVDLFQNKTTISEICNQALVEDKSKIQQQFVDVLALLIEKSTDKTKTTNLIAKSLGVSMSFRNIDEALGFQASNKDQMIFKQVIERQQRGNMPYITEEMIVEFPAPTSTSMASQKQLVMSQQSSFKGLEDANPGEMSNHSQGAPQQQDTFASNLNKLPSQMFMDMKRKQQMQQQQQEEEKKTMFNSVNNNNRSSNYQQQDTGRGSNQEGGEKIAMWLPNFTHSHSVPQTQQNSSKTVNQIPTYANKNMRNSQTSSNMKGENLNSTSSSVATFLEDGKSIQSFNNQMAFSEAKNPGEANGFGFIGQQSYGKSPMLSDSKVYSSLGPNSSMSTNMPSNSTFSSSNMNGVQAQMIGVGNGPLGGRLGYTPESHQSKPRNIASNEVKQRTMDGAMPQFNYGGINEEGGFPIQDLQYDISLNMQKNMSHSSGGSGGFNMNSNSKGPIVNDRLKLLKQKQTSAEKPRVAEYMNSQYEEQDNIPTFSNNNEDSTPTDRMKGNGGFNQRRLNIQGGPVKASHQDDILQTIQNEEYSQDQSLTPNLIKTKKPPLTNKVASSVTKVPSRAQSVDNSLNQAPQSPFPSALEGQTVVYTVVEEPLMNPEKQIQTANEMLKSGDWAKQFEACNTIKRIAMFHKNLLFQSSSFQSTSIKELVKLVDSLRSQLAKNAMLTLATIFENIPAKEIDYLLDTFMPVLLKKAADTNVFITESADQALIAACMMLTDQKVFSCLQGQSNLKSTGQKVKLAMCYNTLIERLGPKIRQFRDMERLIQAVATLLNEGAIEIRNMAKMGILNLKNALGSQRELEAILARCITNDKQFEKIKQIIDRNDFESISNTGSTRYGSSMRTSSLDSRSAGPFRGSAQQQTIASGSDGFGKYTQSSDFNIQNSVSKNGGAASGAASVMTTTNGSQGFNTTANSNSFKKNNLVSKPIDPIVMEEFKQILMELNTNDWGKRIKMIDSLSDFVKDQQSTIKQAQPAKFIQLIDAYCKLLNDNNAKVLSHAQQSFKNILLNPNLQALLEQNLAMVVQALTNNLSSTNAQTREQGDILFNLLEGSVDPNQLLPPIVAQINLANNRSKHMLVERLSSMIERVEKVNLKKYVQPLLQQSNKIQSEAQTNARLKDALQRLNAAANLQQI